MNIQEKAEQYAQNKIRQTLNKVVAEAYIEGYKQGYQDCKEERTAELPEDEIEYVDLGLPSGTLWAKEYFKEGNEQWFPYSKTETMNIPTQEQWKELEINCRIVWHHGNNPYSSYVSIVGRNGNILKVRCIGYCEDDVNKSYQDGSRFNFWLRTTGDTNGKLSAALVYGNPPECVSMFSGYRLPIILVK